MAGGVNSKLATIINQLSAAYLQISEINTAQTVQNSLIGELSGNFSILSGFLNVAIGTFNEAEQGTILYSLRKMQACICLLAGGAEPSGPSPNGCDEPLASLTDRLVSSEGYPGAMFVEWDDVVPQGVELTDQFDPSLPHGVELHLTASTTYYIWVQSTCPSFSLDPAGATSHATNEWVPIIGPEYIAVRVEPGCAAKAFLCIDPGTGFVDCVQRVSTITENVHTTLDNSTRARLAVPLDGLGLPNTSETVSGGHTFTTDSPITWVESNADNYTFEWISGVRIRVWWQLTNGTFNSAVLTSTATTYTITDATMIWGVDNWQDPEGDLEEPFEVRICPPTPS